MASHQRGSAEAANLEEPLSDIAPLELNVAAQGRRLVATVQAPEALSYAPTTRRSDAASSSNAPSSRRSSGTTERRVWGAQAHVIS